ncbi:albusnodin family lasso peptide [Streptomyces sp. NPDC055089]
MNELLSTDPATADEPLIVEIGDAATLTEGQGQGSSEDKRRAYN